MAMPVMDGFEFLAAYGRQLRPHTPVIIISGHIDIVTRGLPPFVIDVLPKPFEVDDLLELVKEYGQPV
jgi:DNA-binding NtrC family response regulator